MSKLIAEIRSPEHKNPLVHVYASMAGVEVTATDDTTFTPTQARTYAAALLEAADEATRMLAKTQAAPKEHGYPEHTAGDIVGIARAAAKEAEEEK